MSLIRALTVIAATVGCGSADSVWADSTEALAVETQSQRKQRLQDYYVVDLIFFKHNEDSDIQPAYPEEWPKDIKFDWPELSWQLMPINPVSIYPELANDFAKLSSTAANKLFEQAPISKQFRAQRLPILTQALSALQGERKKIDRVNRYQLLSHHSWLQKMSAGETAQNIIIPIDLKLTDTINTYQPSFDIDPNKTYVTGSIALRKSRYLHLTTDLLIMHLNNKATGIINNSDAEGIDTGVSIETQQSAMSSANESLMANAPLNQSLQPLPQDASQWPSITLRSRGLEHDYEEKTGLVAIQQEPYPLVIPTEHIQHMAALKQKRKMRSRETHYIDHPLVGLVIRITPVMYLLDENTKN